MLSCGYTLAATVRARETADQHLPILALTASAMPDEAERCSRAGMDALLVKPAGMAELRDALYRWMPAKAEQQHEAAPARAISPIQALTDLFGSSARLDALVDGFVSVARDDLARFDEAMRAADVTAIAGHIHRIDGAVKIFGGAPFADAGEQLRAALLRHGRMDGQEAALRRYREDFLALIDALDRHRADAQGLSPTA